MTEIMQKKAFWKQRRNAVLHTISILKQRIEQGDYQDKGILHDLLEQLSAFGSAQFDFFFTGFESGQLRPLNGNLGPNFGKFKDVNYAIDDYVLSATLDRIADDLSIMQRVMEQTCASTTREDSGIREALQRGDALARAVLRSLNDPSNKLNVPVAKIFTYLQTHLDIRILPYAPIAFIGIPYTVIKATENTGDFPIANANFADYLAIPHEIAHFLYWQANIAISDPQRENKRIYRRVDARLAQGFAELPQKASDHSVYTAWMLYWAEEIFADVVGCLIGGPAIALSFQDIALKFVGQAFNKSDGEHPTPAIRPFIYLETLKQLGHAPNAALLLSEQWQEAFNQRGEPLSIKPSADPQDFQRAAAQAALGSQENPYQKYFTKAVEVILALLPENLKSGVNAWTQDLPPEEKDVTKLYAQFIKQVNELSLNDDPGYSSQPFPLWEEIVKNQIVLDIDLNAPAINPEQWLPIFEMKGWTTEGPNNGPK